MKCHSNSRHSPCIPSHHSCRSLSQPEMDEQLGPVCLGTWRPVTCLLSALVFSPACDLRPWPSSCQLDLTGVPNAARCG